MSTSLPQPTQYFKDPQSKLDYTVDWTAWLGSDTIAASTWTLEAGLTKDSETRTATTSTVWVMGGTPGMIYRATCQITTAGGRIDERSILIVVAQR
jgi:hypothetical protein